jgi:hypothetical protein
VVRQGTRGRQTGSSRAPSHAPVCSIACSIAALCSTLACGGESVAARAIWVDGFAGEDARRIHVYDRGERYTFEVFGESAPKERVRLGPRGRGLIVRAGERRGAWFDLDDGRRLPLLLPPSVAGGTPPVEFAARGDALWWRDEVDDSLTLVPLAPGLALAREEDGSMVPLTEAGALHWARSCPDAPVLLVRETEGDLSFLRYPDDDRDVLGIVREATAEGLPSPGSPTEAHNCLSATKCFSLVGVEPRGELAILAPGKDGPWYEFDRRAPEIAGELELPEPLASAATTGGGLGLLQVLDRSTSVWLGAGQLYRWDRANASVESVPLFAQPLFWFSAERGRALVLLSSTGPMYRVDTERLEILNLETTDCTLAPASEPVVSPSGRWAGWTCLDPDSEVSAASGVVVRVSATGLERHVGVPMSALAIDDEGDLLLFSVESIYTDRVDGVAPTSRPRNLFVLSSEGVLTRIDELEPAPTPVLLGSSDIATFIQGAALD